MMGITKSLIAGFLVLGLLAELGLSQLNIVNAPIGSFGKGPPKNRISITSAKSRLASGGFKTGLPSITNMCDLTREAPYRDPSILRTVDFGSKGQRTNSALQSMALNRALRSGGEEADAVRALQDSSRKVKASQAQARSAFKAADKKRTKRQADMEHLSDTFIGDMCTTKEKLITEVLNDGDRCMTILPQEIKTWECQSKYARGMANPYPFMQKYYCDPGTYIPTSWHVICPSAARGKERIRIHTAQVPINCICKRYKCSFDSYQADAPRLF